MSKHYDQEFLNNAVRYYQEHEDLSLKKFAANLGISCSALSI